jgi:Planctomycete cytochrome C
VGIPVQPPPGWRPPVPQSPRRASTFRAQVGLILRAMLLSMLVIVCMGIGWFLVNGRRTRDHGEQVALKKDKSDLNTPVSTRKDDSSERSTDNGKENPPLPPVVKPKEPTSELTYEKDILPILDQSCTSCHGLKKKNGGLDLRTFQALVKGGDSGAAVVPGKPDSSPLYESIATGQMPPGAKKLSAAERERVRSWIASGAKAK